VFDAVTPLPSRRKYVGARFRKSFFIASTIAEQKLLKQLCHGSGCQFSFSWRRLSVHVMRRRQI
jgi:hypothetical protein